MDTVDELVITPFREVVDKGKQAVKNADDSPEMLKESQRLVKLGEKSLERIESSCRKLYNDYGNNFILALKENSEITEWRKRLHHVLIFDFDDFINPDTFEADKYKELQVLCRDAALHVYNVLITMKLDVPNHFLSQLSPPSSPHSQSLSPTQDAAFQRPFGLASSTPGSASGSQCDALSVADYANGVEATPKPQDLMADRRPSSFQSQALCAATEVIGVEDSTVQSKLVSCLHEPPRPPSLDPWDPRLLPVVETAEADNDEPNLCRPESPVDPAISSMCPGSRQPLNSDAQYLYRSVAGTAAQETDKCDDYRHSGSSTQSNHTNAASHETQPRASTFSPTIPEQDVPRRTNGTTSYGEMPLQGRASLPPQPPCRAPKDSVAARVEDMDRQYQAIIRKFPGQTPTRPLPQPPLNCRDSVSSDNQAPCRRSGTSTPMSQAGLEVAVVVPKDDPDHGLIPVDTEISVKWSPQDCTIGPDSTFCQYKGFCEGAKEVIRGRIGVKKTKRPRISSAAVVARCTGCLFELDFSQIEYDVNKEDKGNFHKSGINYRLRFLQKSHLPAKRVDDVLYACVFCVQAGRTVEESDATVFTTSKALFNHLARHPRPLPKVPGVAVVEGDSMPDQFRNDYDIHVKNPPEAHPVQLNLSKIIGKATGVARDQSRRIYGQRLLFDRSPALDLCHGARLVGIEWREKYKGEWIFAWHDGICASVPADIIKLDLPPSEDIRMVGSSLIRAKARWKFSHREKEKDKSLWLKFDKNELITDIGYPDPNFWCWSGKNSKGSWGVFPKVFLEPSTIQELTVEGTDRALTLTNEKNKSLSMLAKFAPKRRPSGRQSSVAEPTNNFYASAYTHGSI